MEDELAYPESDREHALCWRIFCTATEHTTKGELRKRMSTAIKDQREFCRQATLQGWRGKEPQ
jgi:hypothetical protein